MRYRHDGSHRPHAAKRTRAATFLLAILLALALTSTASASPGTAGSLGLKTRAQIRHFQRAHGLVADGIVGPETRAAMAVVPRGRGHMRATSPAPASHETNVRVEPPASASVPMRSRIEHLAMLAAGIAILIALAVIKLREPVTYRLRILRDSLKRPPNSSGARVRTVPGRVFAEGLAARAGIGRFAGSVYAMTELRGERCFFVRDPRRPRGVWVFESEIRDLEEPHEIEPPLHTR
jgi:hypothetical protein